MTITRNARLDRYSRVKQTSFVVGLQGHARRRVQLPTCLRYLAIIVERNATGKHTVLHGPRFLRWALFGHLVVAGLVGPVVSLPRIGDLQVF
jgi:hypothetical protein